MSTTDPDTTYFSQGDRAPTLGYFDNYLINNGRCVVLAIEATDAARARKSLRLARCSPIVQTKFGLAPKTPAAGTGYGKAEFLTWLETRTLFPMFLCGSITGRMIASTAWIALSTILRRTAINAGKERAEVRRYQARCKQKPYIWIDSGQVLRMLQKG